MCFLLFYHILLFVFRCFFLFNSKSTIKFAIFCLFFAINEPYKQTTNKTLILHRMIIIILAHSSCMWRKRERTELYWIKWIMMIMVKIRWFLQRKKFWMAWKDKISFYLIVKRAEWEENADQKGTHTHR